MKMTKTSKVVNHLNSNGTVKKAAKCVKKRLQMTKEQEASITETITYVIKSKVSPKIALTKQPLAVQQPSRQNVPKRLAKDKSIAHVSRDATAKKTAQQTKHNHVKTAVSAKKQICADIKSNEKNAKRAPKQENNSEIRLNRAENKHANSKVNLGSDTEKQEKTELKSPARKERQDKVHKERKKTDKINNSKQQDDDKPTKQQKQKKIVNAKDRRDADVSKKTIAIKVQNINLKKLNKSTPKAVKVLKVPVAKVQQKKINHKFKIKDELDEVIAAIIKSSVRPENNVNTSDKSSTKQTVKKLPLKSEVDKKVSKPVVPTKKLKPKLKTVSLSNNSVVVKSKKHKTKLVSKPIQQVKSRKLQSIWNGPKRRRVASLNAMAKVHCLYDNEFRGNLDQIDANVKRENSEEKAEKKRDVSPKSTRILRSVPGLRAVGKMWDMHNTTSSSDEEMPTRVETAKRSAKPNEKRVINKTKKPVIKRRKKEEVVMDLKDMVVRKRMASLNASAILAASYSVEKRTRHCDSDTETSSFDEEYSSDDEHVRHEPVKRIDEIKKEEKVDCKVIEMCTAPSKKVAVLLNQDTDVTFTGVYMNSTTRSTHHEGYCHIAGMKYRISATSHTQTAATAVATETILQSTTAHENENVDTTPAKSYTPLDALSNMQPPANASSALQSHHHMPPASMVPPSVPPQQHHHHHLVSHAPHVHHAADVGSLARRHACTTSAFSAPPPNVVACAPQGLHHIQPEHGYVQGYYQPAGPLISVHGHSQAAQPPPTLSTSSVPTLDSSPTSSPLLQPPPPNSTGDSSDSEVVITSVTTAKEALAQQQPLPGAAYRLNHHYPPPPHANYSSYGPYPPQYYGAPPPPSGPPSYPHHDMCYTSFSPHKYMFRRYLPPAPPYYQSASPDIYAQSPNTNQQVVAATSSTSYQSSSTGPPPPTLMDSYPGPPPTLIETYPPPAHYYQGYPPPCYTHTSPARPLNFINATYQPCPCPMQSCPKNVHTGPLAGDSKRSNITISKESMPLPPVALALPLEPASATGPPSPARGSAGMPPPPSPAGATYQAPPPKQETPEPASTESSCLPQVEKRRMARVGKAMVRNTIAQNQQNTMLLMCQTPTISNPILGSVKREVESPKGEILTSEVDKVASVLPMNSIAAKIEQENNIKREEPDKVEQFADDICDLSTTQAIATVVPPINDELLLPCQKTVAENVKVKNMKRKSSMSKEILQVEPVKKAKIDKPNGSYKDLIKKTQNVVKINNGKRKLITETRTLSGILIRIKKNYKRNSVSAGSNKNENSTKRPKSAKPLSDCNASQNVKTNGVKEVNGIVDPELIENKEPTFKRRVKKHLQQPPVKKNLLLPNAESRNKLSNLERTIESVVHNLRTGKRTSHNLAIECLEQKIAKKATGNKGVTKVKRPAEVSTKSATRRCPNKLKAVPQAIPRTPRSSAQLRWSNGWRWHGDSFDGKVFLNSDEATVIRKCYSAMVHEEGDTIELRDCVLLKAGQRKNELPFVAKIAALWENPDDGEMMMSLLWYYRPEHTEQGRRPVDQPDEVFASRHKDSNSVACIEDKCYVLTYNEYCRYRKDLRRLETCIEDNGPCIPHSDSYPRRHRQPPSTLGTSADLVFFCRKVYDFRQKRIIKNPS